MEQLELGDATKSALDAWWDRWVDAMERAIAARGGLKEVAFALDVAPSDISHALNGRERHYFRAQWMLYLLLGSDELAKLAAEGRGLEVSKPKPLTDSEKVKRYEKMFARLGKAGRDLQKNALEDE